MNKQLCTLHPETLEVAEIYNLDKSAGRGAHLQDCCACYCNDDKHPSIILAGKKWTNGPSREPILIQKVQIHRRKRLWKRVVDDMVTALLWIPNSPLLAVGLRNGNLHLLSSLDVEEEWADTKQCCVHSPILSLAVCGDRLAVGTLAGQMYVMRLGEVGDL